MPASVKKPEAMKKVRRRENMAEPGTLPRSMSVGIAARIPLQVDWRSRRGLLPIGQVASRAGIRASTLRYYEQVDLLPVAIRKAGKRVYRPPPAFDACEAGIGNCPA